MHMTTAEIRLWLQQELAGLMEIAPSDLPFDIALTKLGVDSLVAVRLAGVIGERFAIVVEPTVMFDYPSIDALAAYLHSNNLASTPEAV